MKRARTLLHGAVTVVVVLLGAALSGAAARWYWLSPWEPAALYCGLMALPALALLTRPEARWLPLSALLLLGLGAPLSWASPQLRVALAAWGEAPNERAQARCVADRPEVGVACCEAAARAGRVISQERAARWLWEHPDQLNSCMVRAIDGASAQASDLARGLVRRWDDALMTADGEPEQQCALAGAMRHLDRVPRSEAALRLLGCAMSAPDDAARACCEGELVRLSGDPRALVSALPQPEQAVAASRERQRAALTHRLLDASLDSLSPRLATASFDAWHQQLACHALVAGARAARGRALQQLDARLRRRPACAVGVAPLALEAACERWIEGGAAEGEASGARPVGVQEHSTTQPAADVSGQLCELAIAIRDGEAMRHARERLALSHARALGPIQRPDALTRALLRYPAASRLTSLAAHPTTRELAPLLKMPTAPTASSLLVDQMFFGSEPNLMLPILRGLRADPLMR